MIPLGLELAIDIRPRTDPISSAQASASVMTSDSHIRFVHLLSRNSPKLKLSNQRIQHDLHLHDSQPVPHTSPWPINERHDVAPYPRSLAYTGGYGRTCHQ